MTYFDAHCHALFAGRELQGAILRDCETPEEVIERIRSFITANSDETWLDLSAVPAGFEINRWVLDKASTRIPIVVHTDDHHSICVNSKALETAGLHLSAPEVSGGHFDFDNGLPNGWIHEYVAMQLIYAHQPKPTIEQDLAALMLAQEILLANGTSQLTEAWIDPGMPDVYLEAVRLGKLKIKTNLAIRVTPENHAFELDFAELTRERVRAANDEVLTADSIKLFIDGVHSSGTAWLKSDSRTRGVWKATELLKTAQKAVSAGFNLHFHACGDAAVRQALEVVQHCKPHRAIIAHADLIDIADLKEIAAENIIINTTPVWAETAPDNFFNLRAIVDANIPLCFGSDWPVSQPNMPQQIEAAMKFRNLTLEEANRAAKLDLNEI